MTQLHELVSALLATSDLPTALDKVLRATIAITGAGMGNVQLFDAATKSLKIVAQQGFDQDFLDYFGEHTDGTVCARALLGAQRVVVEDVELDVLFAPHREAAAAAGFRAVQSTPLISHRGELLGVLSTHFRNPHRPSEQGLRILDLYTRQAADFIERVRNEEALRSSEARLRTIIEHSPVMLFIKDLDGHYLLANQLYLDRFGFSEEQLLGRSEDDLFAPEIAQRYRDSDRRVRESGEAMQFEESAACGDEMRDYIVNKFLLRDENGAAYAICGIATDITTLKRQQDQLREADRRKDEFLSMLAHELRNPLAPIANAAQVLRLADLPDERVQWASEVIERQTRQLTHLVDDLLDVARIRTGRVQLRRAVVELGVLVRQAAESFRGRFDARQITFSVAAPTYPVPVDADQARMLQVIGNLLDNAAKYTDPGGQVWLHLRTDGRHCEVSVRDTGVGVDPQDLSAIFGLFRQVDHSLHRSAGGLGLGLNLVRHLVTSHGGTVEAHSAGRGRGTEFVVRLPLAEAQPTRPSCAAEAPASPQAHRVLVIDDNNDVAQSMVVLLAALGHNVEAAPNGANGVCLAECFNPEYVFLDIGLPDVDGYEVARQLRRRFGKSLVLVAVTGYGQAEDRRRSKEAGFDWHLTKPVNAQELARVLTPISAS